MMKAQVLYALLGIAVAVVISVPIAKNLDLFDLADSNGDELLSGDEITQFLVMSSKTSKGGNSHAISDEHVLSLAKDNTASLLESGVTALARDDLTASVSQHHGAGWFFSKPKLALKSASEMSAGCSKVEDLAAESCEGWTAIGDECEISGQKSGSGFKEIEDESGKVVGVIMRGTVVIDRPIDVVYPAIADRSNWPQGFDKTLDEAPELRVTEEQGATVQLKWFNKWWAESTVQEMWCKKDGDLRGSFATSVVDPRASVASYALSVDVKTAGVVLKSLDEGRTRVTYITNANVAKFKPEWTKGSRATQAQEIPANMKALIEAHL